MKAKLSLPERPSPLVLLAVFDLLLVLLIFFMILPEGGQEAGFKMEFPKIPYRMPSVGTAKGASISVSRGTPPVIRVGLKEVPLEELKEELMRQREDLGIEWVIISSDRLSNFEQVMEVGYLADAAGLEVMLGGDLPLEKRSGAGRARD